MTDIRSQAREAVWQDAGSQDDAGYDLGYERRSTDAFADKVSNLWEPIVDEAVQIMACATADCPGWEQQAVKFLLKYGKEV